MKKANLLRCARLLRSNVLHTYACAHRMLARLASRTFLTGLQDGSLKSSHGQQFFVGLGVLVVIVAVYDARAIAQEKIRIAPSSPGLAAWPVHLAAKEKFFAAEGLDTEVIVMRTNVGIAALVTGSIDFTTAGGSAMRAVALTPPYSILAKRQGYRDLVRTGDVVSVSPTTGLVTTKDRIEREPQRIRRVIRAVTKAVDYAKARRAETVKFIIRQYKMEKEVADSVYDAIMETLNPTLWLTDQEIQIELNRIAEQTKTKISARPSDLADFSLIKQVMQDFNR